MQFDSSTQGISTFEKKKNGLCGDRIMDLLTSAHRFDKAAFDVDYTVYRISLPSFRLVIGRIYVDFFAFVPDKVVC